MVKVRFVYAGNHLITVPAVQDAPLVSGAEYEVSESLAGILLSRDMWERVGPEEKSVAPSPVSILMQVKGIGEKTARALVSGGIRTLEDLTGLTVAEIDAKMDGTFNYITGTQIEDWRRQARLLIGETE